MAEPISHLDRIGKLLHHPGFQLPLYGTLAAGDVESGLEEWKKGKSGLSHFAGAGALGLMAAPYVIDLIKMMKKGEQSTQNVDVITELKSVL